MRTVSLEELLEAGCHFGHQVTRHNPKSRDFVFEARDNIHIIDLARTKEGLEDAGKFVKALAARGGTLAIVGTKRQARTIVEAEVKRAIEALTNGTPASGLYTITNRWIGGTLTNFPEVAKNYRKLTDLTAKMNNPEERAKYTKKEIGLWGKERAKLESFYGGAVDMKQIPDALFIIDTHLEHLAVHEAQKMNVTTVGIVDTNADPSAVSYAIPANDDAVGSLQLIIGYIIDAWIEGRKDMGKAKEAEAKKEEKKSEPKAEEKPAKKVAKEAGKTEEKKELKVKKTAKAKTKDES